MADLSYTDLHASYFQNTFGFPLSGLLASFEQFMYVQMGDSPFTHFVAIAYAKWREGREALEEASQACSAWPNIHFVFQSMLADFGNGLQCLKNIFQLYQNVLLGVNQELQQIVDMKTTTMSSARWQVIQSQQNPNAASHLRLNALASSFRVCFLSFLNGAYTISLPSFTCGNERFTLVSVVYLEWYTAVFAGKVEGLQFLENVSRFFQHVDVAQKVAEGESISAQNYLLLNEFITESVELREAIEELLPNLDSVAAGIVEQARTLQALLNCASCEANDTVRLDCLHWVCRRCVFGARGWDPGADVVCPGCSRCLTLLEIRSLLPEKVFDKTLSDARSDSNLLCPKCQKLILAVNFRELECQHKVCNACFVSAVQKAEMLCILCQTYPKEEHIHTLETSNTLCSVCFQEKSIKKFPAFNCPGHWVCFDCFERRDQCPECLRQLTEDEQGGIAHSFFKCQLCNELINRKKLYKGGVCGCRVCETCFAEKLKQTRKISQCFECKARFPVEAIDHHYQMFRKCTDDMIVPELERIVHQRSVKRAPCALCDGAEKMVEKVELVCQHVIHEFCLTQFLASLRVKLSDPSCPICSKRFDCIEVSQNCAALFPKEPRCSSCNGLLTDAGDNQVKCEAENIVYCKKCFAKPGDNHSEADCEAARRKFVATVLRKQAAKDPACRCIIETCPKCRHVAQCPNCRTPQLNKCGAKTCRCAACKTEFCHGCSAPCSPIAAHGDLWHRPQCPYSKRKTVDNLAEAIANIAKAEDCSECGKTEGRCAPPQDLAVRGEFP